MTPDLVHVGNEWINPRYVLRIWETEPTTHSGREWPGYTIVRMVDGSVVTVETDLAEVVAIVRGEL